MPSVTVKGMSCEHCRKAVTEAIAKFQGVSDVQVDLKNGLASWTAGADAPALEDVKKAISGIGFEPQ